jgi:hypothetical protein
MPLVLLFRAFVMLLLVGETFYWSNLNIGRTPNLLGKERAGKMGGWGCPTLCMSRKPTFCSVDYYHQAIQFFAAHKSLHYPCDF